MSEGDSKQAIEPSAFTKIALCLHLAVKQDLGWQVHPGRARMDMTFQPPQMKSVQIHAGTASFVQNDGVGCGNEASNEYAIEATDLHHDRLRCVPSTHCQPTIPRARIFRNACS